MGCRSGWMALSRLWEAKTSSVKCESWPDSSELWES